MRDFAAVMSVFDSDPDMSGIDMRTRAGREEEVLRKIRADGGFSVFWAMEFKPRANAIGRLKNSGRISVLPGGEFPFCPYRVKETSDA